MKKSLKNSLEICEYCGGEFKFKGIGPHRRSCLRKQNIANTQLLPAPPMAEIDDEIIGTGSPAGLVKDPEQALLFIRDEIRILGRDLEKAHIIESFLMEWLNK